MKKLLLITTALLMAPTVAKADLIVGQVSIFSDYILSGPTITFFDNQGFYSIGPRPCCGDGAGLTFLQGDYAPLGNGTNIPTGAIGWRNQGNPLDINLDPGFLWYGISNGLEASFSITDVTIAPNGCGATTLVCWFGNGVATLTGFDPTPMPFSMTLTPGLHSAGFTAFNPPVPIPAPIVGSGLMGGFAALGLWFLGRRRAR